VDRRSLYGAFADVGPFKIPEELTDDQVFFSPTSFHGYMAAENCNIQDGDTVAVWGCGPSASLRPLSSLLGAKQVVAIDTCRERLQMARMGRGHIDMSLNPFTTLLDLTGGLGPIHA